MQIKFTEKWKESDIKAIPSDNFAEKLNFLFIFSIQCDILKPLKKSKGSSKKRKMDGEYGSN